MFEMMNADIASVMSELPFRFEFNGLLRGGLFEKQTRFFYDDGVTGEAPTIICQERENRDISVRSRLTINGASYEVFKIQKEDYLLLRLFLKKSLSD